MGTENDPDPGCSGRLAATLILSAVWLVVGGLFLAATPFYLAFGCFVAYQLAYNLTGFSGKKAVKAEPPPVADAVEEAAPDPESPAAPPADSPAVPSEKRKVMAMSRAERVLGLFALAAMIGIGAAIAIGLGADKRIALLIAGAVFSFFFIGAMSSLKESASSAVRSFGDASQSLGCGAMCGLSTIAGMILFGKDSGTAFWVGLLVTAGISAIMVAESIEARKKAREGGDFKELAQRPVEATDPAEPLAQTSERAGTSPQEPPQASLPPERPLAVRPERPRGEMPIDELVPLLAAHLEGASATVETTLAEPESRRELRLLKPAGAAHVEVHFPKSREESKRWPHFQRAVERAGFPHRPAKQGWLFGRESVCVECPLDEEHLSKLLHIAFVTVWGLDENTPIVVS